MVAIEILELEELGLVVEQRNEFNIEEEKEFLELFEKYIDKGIIREDIHFNDEKWIFIIGGVEEVVLFPNDLEYKKLSILFDRPVSEIILAYKCFVLSNIRKIKSVIIFNQNMKKIAKSGNETKLTCRSLNLILDFIQYIKISEEQYATIEELIISVEEKIPESRILPEFEYIFKMADIINDIVNNKDLLNYKDYLITIMWWKICSSLPLRPTEFLRTNFNCVYEENNEYYLSVKRSKAKSKKHIVNISKVEDYYYDDEISIDEEIYNLILKYQEILQKDFEYNGEELFPFIIIERASYYKKNNKSNRTKNIDTITYVDLNKNINNFYKNIIEKEYKLKAIPKYIKKHRGEDYIEITLPYDLRHIAIINLILMGIDVLEVMYLAGHENINTAYGYFNHVKEFARGYALNYMKSQEVKRKMDEKERVMAQEVSNIKILEAEEEFNKVLSIINGERFTPRRVKDGYCYYSNIDNDKSFCHYYERKHSICKYFIADDEKVIKKEIKQVEYRVDTEVKLLIELVKDMTGIANFEELYQVTSNRLANSISELSQLYKKELE